MKEAILKIKFPNQIFLEHFVNWLETLGEQDYWEWLKMGRDKRYGVEFIYSHPQDEKFAVDDARRYINADYLNDNTILTEVLVDDEYD